MKKLPFISLLLVLIIIFYSGCVEDPMTTYYTEIINKSDHKIDLSTYSHANIEQRSIQLAEDEKYTESQSMHRSGDFNQFDLYSSVNIIYDDTLSVTYNSIDSLWYHNIFINDSWISKHNDEYSYRYTYVFTNEDYEYALEQQK